MLTPATQPAKPDWQPATSPTPSTTPEPFIAPAQEAAAPAQPNQQPQFDPTTKQPLQASTPQLQNDQPTVSEQPKSKLRGFMSFMLFVLGVLLTAFLINQFIFQSYFVDGTSMTPTLQNNDRLIIEKVSRSVSRVQGKAYIPQRGQIVVLDSSLTGANGKEEQLIKRVIGLPGETLIVDAGKVTIKNTEHPEGFDADVALELILEPTYSDERIEITIPKDHVYVMGDNRVQYGSQDSRIFGPVASDKLEGRLWARILPLSNARTFSLASPLLFP